MLVKIMQSLKVLFLHACDDQHLVVALLGFPVELADSLFLCQDGTTPNKSMMPKLCKGSKAHSTQETIQQPARCA